jgi:CheY-like chemotaxis protein
MINHNLKNAKILVVDDQQANIDIIDNLLEIQGYTNIKWTTDSREVIPIYSIYKPDLILLDLMMPFFNGFEIMEQLKPLISKSEFVPILVLTADITKETKEKALSDGAKDFILKPFDLIEVSLRIQNLLETRWLYLQLDNQNQILEDKVKERTTDLEQMNAELAIAIEKAEESNRLKTAFIQNISHEVRTPLNGIIGITELIVDSSYSNEEKQEFVPLLKKSSTRLINTITDYVDISMVVSENIEVNLKEMNLNKEIYSIINSFKDECDVTNLILTSEIPYNTESFVIKTDVRIFHKIYSHLLNNAIKFTKAGSITVGYKIVENNIEFFVRDTGIGIKKEAQEKIFDYFMQEDNSSNRGFEGSGLGLTIAKGFVKLLHGNLRIESTKGLGSSFYFSLPNITDTYFPKIKNNELKQTSIALPTILIVDDDDTNRIYFKHVLKNYATDLIQAKNGKEAVEICRANRDISFVIMDIKMPIMNGYEATREIKSFWKELPIIAITAFAMSADEKLVLEAGCDDYIAKPVSSKELIAKLKKIGLLKS